MSGSRRELSPRALISIALSVVVLAVIVAAVLLLDSPAQARLARLDERRMSDLREVANLIDVYWTREGQLPASLSELADDVGHFAELVDPETGDSYEYRVVDEDSYELCATFATEDVASDRDPYFQGLWQRRIGRQCFTLKPQDLNQLREGR